MSDFLSNLVDRALDRGPVLERRRPSLFEPVRGAAGVGGASAGTALAQDEAEGSNFQLQDQAQSKKPTSPSATHSETSPAQAAQKPLTAVREFESAQPQKVSLTAVWGEPNENIQPRPSQAQRRIADEEVARNRIVETIIETKIEQTQPLIRREEVLEPKNQSLPPPPSTPIAERIVRVVEAVRDTRVKTTDKSQVQPLPPTPSKSPSRPFLTPAPIAQPAISRQQRRVSPEREIPPALPTIQITIGRLEIRATSPAAVPPRASRSAGPKLSLDAYLRSRNGGSR